MESNTNIISVPYCQLQSLLHVLEPQAYTCGVYGWNADVYQVAPDTVIVMGYRPFGNVKPHHRLNKKYEKLAEQALSVCTKCEICEAKINELINLYVKEVLESEGK